MKSPFTGGKAKKKVKSETFSFRNERYTVKRYYYQCQDTGKIFSNAEVDDKIMKDVYNQYRERHGIPAPSELRKLRDTYGISAHIMSKIAGIGINQYGLYENGEMPTEVIGHRLSELFDKKALLKSIDKASVKLGKDYIRIKANVESYSEPKSFSLTKVFYGDYSEIKPFAYLFQVYHIKKSRWVTCEK